MKNLLNLFIVTLILTFQNLALAGLPEFIDLRKDKLNQRSMRAFNNAPEIIPIIASLKLIYDIDVAVETGTAYGTTTSLLSYLFKEVYTVEINEKNFKIAQSNLNTAGNVKMILGSSEKALEDLLPNLQNKKILFYLDAHWGKYWPLLDELEVISKTHKDNCVIIIDDALVPNEKNIKYDSYDGNDLSYEYVKEKIDKIFTSYSTHYIIPAKVVSRGKLLFIPTQWEKN